MNNVSNNSKHFCFLFAIAAIYAGSYDQLLNASKRNIIFASEITMFIYFNEFWLGFGVKNLTLSLDCGDIHELMVMMKLLIID